MRLVIRKKYFMPFLFYSENTFLNRKDNFLMAFISHKSLSVSSNDTFVSFQVCLSIFSIKLQVKQKPIKHDIHHSIDNNTPAEPINRELMIRHRVTTSSSSNHISFHKTI